MFDQREEYEAGILELALAARRVGELGYVSSHGGNLSYRVSEDTLLITPTKVEKRKMQADDIVVVNMDGAVISAAEGRRPTGELPMHLHLYGLRPDLNALVHAHPPILTGFSMVDRSLLELPLLPEPVLEVGPVVSVPYGEPVSDELARKFTDYAGLSNAWLMQNHGITLGSSEGIERAVGLLEMTEAMALSVSVAVQLGSVRTIPMHEVAAMERTIASREMPRPGDPRIIGSLTDLYQR